MLLQRILQRILYNNILQRRKVSPGIFRKKYFISKAQKSKIFKRKFKLPTYPNKILKNLTNCYF